MEILNWDQVESLPVTVLRASGALALERRELEWELKQRLTLKEKGALATGQWGRTARDSSHRQLAQLLAYLDWTGRP